MEAAALEMGRRHVWDVPFSPLLPSTYLADANRATLVTSYEDILGSLAESCPCCSVFPRGSHQNDRIITLLTATVFGNKNSRVFSSECAGATLKFPFSNVRSSTNHAARYPICLYYSD